MWESLFLANPLCTLLGTLHERHMILKTKLSRAVFTAGIPIAFILFHFTGTFGNRVQDFSTVFSEIIKDPLVVLPLYLGIIIVPALIASVLIPWLSSVFIPWLTKWIRSGD